MKISKLSIMSKGVTLAGLVLIIVASLSQPLALAESTPTTGYPRATPGEPLAVLTIVLRDSIGNPLEGVTCEVLSYGWGLEINKAFAVIARGETDKYGVVAFDDSRWPKAGYRFRFEPTDHVKPAGTYFLPDDQNQYRGFPGAVVGRDTQTQRFVLSGSDSVVYNDISKEGQSPAYQRDPIAGLEKPRTTLMDGKDYVATAVAATTTAEARGEPTPTIPAPPSPSPRPGEIQPALTITPALVLTAVAATIGANGITSAGNSPTINSASTTTANQSKAAGTATGTATTTSVPSPVVTQPALAQTSGTVTTSISSTVPTSANSAGSSNLLVSILLAVFGVVCLALFWKYRYRIYPLFGIEATKPFNRRVRAISKSAKNGKREAVKGAIQTNSPANNKSETEQSGEKR